MKRKIVIAAAVLLIWMAVPAAAAEVGQAQAEALEVESLEQAAEEYTGGLDLTTGTSLDEGLRQILDTGSEQVSGILRQAVRSGVLLLCVVLLTALADGLGQGLGGSGVDAAALAGALAVTAVAVGDVNILIGMGRETIENIGAFSKLLLPSITAAAAAAGMPGSAVVRQVITMLFSDILFTLIDKLLLPMVYLYIASSTAYAAFGNEGLKRIGATLKWAVTGILTALMLIFVAYLTVSGVIAGTTDAVTVRATKFAVSSVVPVVGGILADAAETVLAGAGILRNAVGVFGMLAALAMCITPFLQLGIHYLVYKMTSALTATVAQGRVAGLIDSIGGAFALVLGMTGACALLLLISLISAISLTVG